jgi:hypothetical protein
MPFSPFSWWSIHFSQMSTTILAVYILALCLSALALVARLVLRHRRVLGFGDHVHCATCDYIITPHSSMICPECGSDVREKGLASAQIPPPLKLGSLYLVIALLGLACAMPLTKLVQDYQPFGWRFQVTRIIMPRIGRDGRLSLRYMVTTIGSGRYFGRTMEHIWVNPDQELLSTHDNSLVVRPNDLSVERRGAWVDAPAPEPFTHDLAVRYATLNGAPELAEEIEDAVRDFAAARFPRSNQMLPSEQVQYQLTDAATFIVLAGSYLLITITSCLFVRHHVSRRCRRRTREWRREAIRLALIPPGAVAAVSVN